MLTTYTMGPKMAGKLIMCKGLPGSGKSTWAEEQVQKGLKDGNPVFRVNKDEIRIDLGLSRSNWTRESEYQVIDRRDHLISEALKKGWTVISDDTNFGRKHEPRLRELAKKYGAEFEINDSFLSVPLETCIERDKGRSGEARVGENVIRGMYDQHVAKGPDYGL